LPTAASGILAGPWRQQLEQATKDLYDSFYKQPTQGIGSGQARAYLELKQQLRRIRTESRHLAASLGKGEGHDETLPIWRNLMEEVRSAQDNARRVYTTGPVTERANTAREALEKLAPYYDTGS
jgi:hypothetical protein